MTDLLPCPFCGGKPESEPWHGGAPTKVMISCSNAEYGDEDGGCSVGPQVTGETPEEAAAAWNRRSSPTEGDNQRIIEFARYLEDFNSLGGGAMRARYGDEPMAGFANVIEHFRPIAQRARSALGRNAG